MMVKSTVLDIAIRFLLCICDLKVGFQKFKADVVRMLAFFLMTLAAEAVTESPQK